MSAWAVAEFRAMGSSCRIVAPDRELAELGQRLVADLEARWSRFIPSSEISSLNEVPGRLSVVSADTFELIDCAQRARFATAGRFNPLMLDQLSALGYDRSWEQVADGGELLQQQVVPTDAPIEMFADISAVRLPPGARFDPGGIGKGLAADIVARSLVASGASSVQVELGGDVRVIGPEWSGGEWRVIVDDRDHGVDTAATISLAEGGVATSSVLSKRWRRGNSTMHHQLDAATGYPAETDLESVTAVAPTLWWAEVVAKVALIGGHHAARSVMEGFGITGVLVTTDANSRYDVMRRPDGTA